MVVTTVDGHLLHGVLWDFLGVFSVTTSLESSASCCIASPVELEGGVLHCSGADAEVLHELTWSVEKRVQHFLQ
jgi:hypothetical protein